MKASQNHSVRDQVLTRTVSWAHRDVVRVDSTCYFAVGRVQQLDESQQALLDKSATRRKFELLGGNTGCQASNAGTQFIVVDTKVLSDLLMQVKCGSCCVKILTLTKAADKEYGLAVKLLPVLSACEFRMRKFFSPRVAVKAASTFFEVNMSAMKGVLSIGKGATALADLCASTNLSHRGLHDKNFRMCASENAASDIEAASMKAVKRTF